MKDKEICIPREGVAGSSPSLPFRELKEFEFDDHGMSDERLEVGQKDHTLVDGSNGWSPDDTFLMNEKKYGVQTSYKENVEGYTMQLKQEDNSSGEYRDREARATKLAAEIDGDLKSGLRLELENTDDEEEAFSAQDNGSRFAKFDKFEFEYGTNGKHSMN